MKNQHKTQALTSIKITEDVRDWINEIRQILRDNLQKPSLSQNETIRWMCIQTIQNIIEIYQENFHRRHSTLNQTTQVLDKELLYEGIRGMREEELKEKKPDRTIDTQ